MIPWQLILKLLKRFKGPKASLSEALRQFQLMQRFQAPPLRAWAAAIRSSASDQRPIGSIGPEISEDRSLQACMRLNTQ